MKDKIPAFFTYFSPNSIEKAFSLSEEYKKNKSISGEIPSPTFSLLQTYKFKKVLINHYDFYRLEKEEDLIELDYANSVSNGICLMSC